MKHQLKTGLSFGLTSAIITTLGLMIGLISGTESKIVVIGGILTIAINVVYGLSLLSILSYFLAKWEREVVWKVILEHLIVAIVVIILANWIGIFIKNYFG
jgi:amino acid transporter